MLDHVGANDQIVASARLQSIAPQPIRILAPEPGHGSRQVDAERVLIGEVFDELEYRAGPDIEDGPKSVVIDQRPGLEVNLFLPLVLERRIVEEPVLEPGLVAVFDAITVQWAAGRYAATVIRAREIRRSAAS